MSDDSGKSGDLDEIRFEVKCVFEEQELRNKTEYDGIMGSLPDWVPDSVQRDFERHRNLVLDVWGYKADKALALLDQFRKEGDWILRFSETDSSGREIDFGLYSIVFGFLANLRWALDHSPEDALNFLGGDLAVRGYRNKMRLSAGKNTPTPLQILANTTFERLADLRGEFPTAEQVANAMEQYDNPANPIISKINWDWGEITYFSRAGKTTSVGISQFRRIVTTAKSKYSHSRESANQRD